MCGAVLKKFISPLTCGGRQQRRQPASSGRRLPMSRAEASPAGPWPAAPAHRRLQRPCPMTQGSVWHAHLPGGGGGGGCARHPNGTRTDCGVCAVCQPPCPLKRPHPPLIRVPSDRPPPPIPSLDAPLPPPLSRGRRAPLVPSAQRGVSRCGRSHRFRAGRRGFRRGGGRGLAAAEEWFGAAFCGNGADWRPLF